MSEQLSAVKTEELASLPTPYYFDVMGGQLLVGQHAYEAHVESGGHPVDIYPLGHMLTDKDVEISPSDFSPLVADRKAEWPVPDKVDHGVWLHSVVSVHPYHKRLSIEVLRRAYRLGLALGGHQKILQSDTIDGMGHYLKMVGGVEGSMQTGMYDNWSITDSLEYVREVANEVEKAGHKPRERDYARHSKSGKGPSTLTLERITGQPISTLLDRVGYPDTRHWPDASFIIWGLQFMLANDGRLPDTKDLDMLSHCGRGPSTASITVNYGLKLFQQRVAEHYPEAMKVLRAEYLSLRHDERYRDILAQQPDTVSGHLRSIQMAARSQLIEKSGLPVSEEQMESLLLIRDSALFIKAVCRRLPDFEQDEIKRTLRSPELSDMYLRAFPLNDFMNNLKVA